MPFILMHNMLKKLLLTDHLHKELIPSPKTPIKNMFIPNITADLW